MQNEIMNIKTLPELLSSKVIYDIQEEPEEVREMLRATLMLKMEELGASESIKKQVLKIFKACDGATKKLEAEYSKSHDDYNEIKLEFNGKKQPKPTTDNFLKILHGDPMFADIKYNLLSNAPEIVKNNKVERWSDKNDSKTRLYIEEKYKIHSKDKLDDALRVLFSEREYHPIRNIIDGITWDGKTRINDILIKWLKCEDTPYTREVSRLIFAGGINRLYNPGCKFDDVPVLIGTKQGEGKSTFVRWLALKDEFFTEVTEIEGQKGMEAIEGAWICEIAELLALTKTKEVEAVKAYITKQADRYRRPFDKRISEIKRQCIFVGTTNRKQFLTDKTGNRRFYPITVYSDGFDLYDHEKEVREDIMQAWAEAKYLYNKGELKPYINRSVLKYAQEAQNEAVEDDYRVGIIKSYLTTKEQTCIIDLWQNALQNTYAKPTRRESNELTMILEKLPDWERYGSARIGNFGVQTCWRKVHPKCN